MKRILVLILFATLCGCQVNSDSNRKNRRLYKSEMKQNEIFEAYDFFADSGITKYTKNSSNISIFIPFENIDNKGIVFKYKNEYCFLKHVSSGPTGCIYIVENRINKKYSHNDSIAINPNNKFELLLLKPYFSGHMFYSFEKDPVDNSRIRINVYCYQVKTAAEDAPKKSLSSFINQTDSSRNEAKISEFEIVTYNGLISEIHKKYYINCECQYASLLNSNIFNIYKGQYISDIVAGIISRSFYPKYYW